MLYYNFKSHEEFKAIFGTPENRKNRILLALLKSRDLLHDARISGDYSLLEITSISELRQLVTERIIESGQRDESLPYTVRLLDRNYRSAKYMTDDYQGVCEDGDTHSVRYINKDSDKVYKMKAGKMFRQLILETQFGKMLPIQVITFMCEEFANSWRGYSMSTMPNFQLVVDQDFEKIYDSESLEGDVESCMSGKSFHYFYEDSVDASAAYLVNKESGYIIARCIIFSSVTDEYGQSYRLAERQYAVNGNNVYKRLLVDSLISGGYIDGYKSITAGCSDSREFVDNSGASLYDKHLKIDCRATYGDVISYQDSFKYLNLSEQIAYNYSSEYYDVSLDITDGEFEEEEPQEWDSYHETWCDDVVTVYAQGERYTCDSDDLHAFILFEGEYYHEDDIEYCPHCNSRFVVQNGEYSEVTEESYCCYSCLEEAESEEEDEEENDDNDDNDAENAA
ncbi:MAG: hypothetical protein SNI45_05560 [Rikenellaceae bacterium]